MSDRPLTTGRRCRIPVCAASRRSIRLRRAGVCSPIVLLAFEAYAKAEHTRCRWRAARLAGDRAAAERARRLMLRHQAIAYHLDPNRGTK